MDKKVYRLFALPLTTQNIGIASGERFSRATPSPAPGYVLIYTTAEIPDAVEITENEVDRLSSGDSRWLFDCNTAILAEELKNHEADVVKDLSFRMEALEEELKRRKQEIEMKGDGAS